MIRSNLKEYRLSEIDSTNDFAKSIAETKEDSLIIANKQTAGKGRMGRSFFSPNGGIYMSLLLHPDKSFASVQYITVMASVAVSRAIESVLGITTEIKWVNDIFKGNKKVCGILTEGSYNAEKKCFDYAVLGLGINLFKPKDEYPDDIKNIAGYLIDNENESVKDKLIYAFVDCFFDIYNGNLPYLSEYKRRSNVLGKSIEYVKNGKKYRAKAIDINDNFELVVETQSGRENLNSGEIKICLDSMRENDEEKN